MTSPTSSAGRPEWQHPNKGTFMLEEATRREQIDLSLLRRYHEDGDVLAREELAQRCMPLVRSLARKYAGRGEQLEDLVQAGLIGLVKAIDRFDADAGHRFVSFAVPNITGEIRRHFRDHTWAVHVPRSLQELDAQVQSTRAALANETGREPSDDDLAAELDVPVEQIREAKTAGQSYRALSLDHPAGETRDVADTHGVSDPGFARVEAACTVQDAMEVLDERERQVVDWRFRDELLQREIAERIGVSQMQVSRILSTAVARMSDHVAGDEDVAALAA
jgi:RNA polymerase sigma-B factor